MTEVRKIQSVQRAIDILNCFDENNLALTLTQISTMLGLNKGTVHGILSTLYNNGYIYQDTTGKYLLGQALLDKANYAQDTRHVLLATCAYEEMDALCRRFKATSTLYGIKEEGPVLLKQLLPKGTFYVIGHPSGRDPWYSTATGKLFLSSFSPTAFESYAQAESFKSLTSFTITSSTKLRQELKEIRTQGYAFETEELVEGVAAIAHPILGHGGNLLASISLTGFAPNIQQRKGEILSALRESAARIQDKIANR